MKYKAVIFDLFGTLVDNFSSQEFDHILSEMAIALSVPYQDFAQLWKFETWHERMTGLFPTVAANIERVCRVLGLQPEADRIAKATQIRFDFTKRVLTPRLDAIETLSQVKAAGYKTGLISNCSAEVPLLWPDTPFAPLVDVPIFSCVVGLEKPDLRIYQLACERLSVMSQGCLYIDDNRSYLAGASQVGMHAVLIRVPYEDIYDGYYQDAGEWQGATISALKDVLTLVDL